MLKRVLTGVFAFCILLPVLYFADTFILPLGIAVVSVIATYEMAKCMGFHKRLAVTLPLYLFGLASPFLIRYLSEFLQYVMIAFIAAALYLMYLFFYLVLSHGKVAFEEAISFFAVSVYILSAMCAILCIHDLQTNGEWLYLLIFIGAWVTDTFAYFTGRFLGKHKLIEAVSPKKTVEGSIGGIFFCMIFFVVYGLVMRHFLDISVSLIFLAVSGILVSVISQIGDLIMSLIKRHYQIKDFGKIFPGHGGVLDRFDSILAVSLAMAALCVFVNLLGVSWM